MDVIRALVSHGADVNANEQWQGQTPLMWAATQSNTGAVKALIELGADKDAKSKLLEVPRVQVRDVRDGVTVLPRGAWTPLMYAAAKMAPSTRSALTDAKVNLNTGDPDGTTALMLAIINAHYDLAAVLIDKGADPNIADSTGTTALYSAVDMHTMRADVDRPTPKLVDELDAADS